MSSLVNPTMPPRRSRWPLRWWLGLALMFALQLGLIFWLSDTRTLIKRPPGPAPGIQMASSGAADVMALLDPTLFALPHRQGFSGRAWLDVQPHEYPVFSWDDQPAWLKLPVQSLGTAFQDYVATNAFAMPRISFVPPPASTVPAPAEPQVFAEPSTYRIAGQLSSRQVVTPPELRSWTNAELLSNSVVQLLVNGQGRPLSAALVGPSCGLQQADAYALAQARAMRFNSILNEGPRSTSEPLANLAWGQVTFQWHTVPKPLTNAVSAK